MQLLNLEIASCETAVKLCSLPIAPNPIRGRKKETVVCNTKALFPLLIAALLIATAGSAIAKKDQNSQQGKATAQKRVGKDLLYHCAALYAQSSLHEPRVLHEKV